MSEIFYVTQVTVYWLIHKIQVHIASIQGAELPKSRSESLFTEWSVASLGLWYKFPNIQRKTLLPTFHLDESTHMIMETVLTSKYVMVTEKKTNVKKQEFEIHLLMNSNKRHPVQFVLVS